MGRPNELERSGSSAEQAGSGGADTATASPQVPFSLPLKPDPEFEHLVSDNEDGAAYAKIPRHLWRCIGTNPATCKDYRCPVHGVIANQEFDKQFDDMQKPGQREAMYLAYHTNRAPTEEEVKRGMELAPMAEECLARNQSAAPAVPFSLPLKPATHSIYGIDDAKGVFLGEILGEDEHRYVIAAVNQHEELKRQKEVFRAQINAAAETERKDCERVLLALAGIGYPTPAEGYGTNSSWAISDAVRAIKERAAAEQQKEELLKALEEINGLPLDSLRIRLVAQRAIAKIKRGERPSTLQPETET